MTQFEVVNPQLSVARSVCPELAEQLVSELDSMEDVYQLFWLPDVYPDTTGDIKNYHGNLYPDSDMSPDAVRLLPIPTLGRIASLPLFEGHLRYTLNKQAPHSKQGLHPDITRRPHIDVVQLSPNGEFYGEDVRLDAGTGDVVRLHDRHYRHGGANPSDNVRYNVVLSRYAEDPPFSD